MTLILPSRISSAAAWTHTQTNARGPVGKSFSVRGPRSSCPVIRTKLSVASRIQVSPRQRQQGSCEIFHVPRRKHYPCQHAAENCEGPVSRRCASSSAALEVGSDVLLYIYNKYFIRILLRRGNEECTWHMACFPIDHEITNCHLCSVSRSRNYCPCCSASQMFS